MHAANGGLADARLRQGRPNGGRFKVKTSCSFFSAEAILTASAHWRAPRWCSKCTFRRHIEATTNPCPSICTLDFQNRRKRSNFKWPFFMMNEELACAVLRPLAQNPVNSSFPDCHPLPACVILRPHELSFCTLVCPLARGCTLDRNSKGQRMALTPKSHSHRY